MTVVLWCVNCICFLFVFFFFLFHSQSWSFLPRKLDASGACIKNKDMLFSIVHMGFKGPNSFFMPLLTDLWEVLDTVNWGTSWSHHSRVCQSWDASKWIPYQALWRWWIHDSYCWPCRLGCKLYFLVTSCVVLVPIHNLIDIHSCPRVWA